MKKLRVLIVDDDGLIASVLKEWLEINGHQATTAEAVDDFVWLSSWQWQNLDCIVTGINQAGLNGIDFTRLVRKTGGPPVIVMSGYLPEIAKVWALEAGAAAFLRKPFKLTELLEVIDSTAYLP
jgi:DNA-binding response OmpR family regulator